MDISQVPSIINFCIKAKKNGINIPLMLWGMHGVGKTEVIRDTFVANGFNTVTLNTALQSPEDLLGQIDNKGGYHRPKWMVDYKKVKTPTVYILDEFNRGQKYVLQCMFNFILSGKLHQHEIGPDDIVIGACNPDTEDFTVTAFDDRAMVSRFLHIKVTQSVTSFMKHQKNKYKSSKKGIKILEQVFDKTVNIFPNTEFKMHFDVVPDTRNYERCINVLDMITEDEMKEFGYELIAGMIGTEAAATIQAEYFAKTSLNADDLMKNGHESMNINVDQMEVVNAVNVSIISQLQDYEKNKQDLTETENKNLYNWVMEIPTDCSVKLLQSMCKIDAMVIVVHGWMTDHFDNFQHIYDQLVATEGSAVA